MTDPPSMRALLWGLCCAGIVTRAGPRWRGCGERLIPVPWATREHCGRRRCLGGAGERPTHLDGSRLLTHSRPLGEQLRPSTRTPSWVCPP
jgi:hypothetical protein